MTVKLTSLWINSLQKVFEEITLTNKLNASTLLVSHMTFSFFYDKAPLAPKYSGASSFEVLRPSIFLIWFFNQMPHPFIFLIRFKNMEGQSTSNEEAPEYFGAKGALS